MNSFVVDAALFTFANVAWPQSLSSEFDRCPLLPIDQLVATVAPVLPDPAGQRSGNIQFLGSDPTDGYRDIICLPVDGLGRAQIGSRGLPSRPSREDAPRALICRSVRLRLFAELLADASKVDL
jgi:hypothetical protein